MMDTLRAAASTGPLAWPCGAFVRSVAAHFGATQAALIQSRCADRAQLMRLPANEFMALLVKNG
jgi:hypothetical protein